MAGLSEELERTAASLKASRERALEALAACSLYVDKQAAEGDALAGALSHMVKDAFVNLAAENIGAASILEELR